MHILIVEDDPAMVETLRLGLEEEKHSCAAARTAREARARLAERPCDLILLDVELPGEDGLSLLEELRGRHDPRPVLIMSGGRKELADRIRGLDLGADDYLLKPFEFRELLARIGAVARRAAGQSALRLQVADLEIQLAAREVKRGGRTVELTQREFALLEYLAQRAGRLVTREMIAHDVWKEPARATPLDNVIDVHLSHLRQKIDDGHETKLIHTEWGKGFTLKAPAP